MKQTVSLLLILVLCLFFAGCGSEPAAAEPSVTRSLSYFEEAPSIPTPDSAFDLAVFPQEVENGKSYYCSHVTSPNQTLTTTLNYLALLSECGFSVRPANDCYMVSQEGQDCMMVQLKGTVMTLIFLDSDIASAEDEIIEMETPVVLADNKYFRMELLRFRKVVGAGSHATRPNVWEYRETGVTYYADVQFYNVSDQEYNAHAELYLGEESVLNLIQFTGSHGAAAPAPGKNSMMQILVTRWDGSQELPMELEELYTLNGALSIFSGSLHEEIPISVPESMTGNMPQMDQDLEYEVILFEPGVTLVDNEYVTIELTGFREKPYHWSSGDTVEKLFDFTVTNHSSNVIDLNCACYVGNDRVRDRYEGYGQLAPGKTGTYSLRIYHEDKTPLDSLEDLYQLNGTFEILPRGGDDRIIRIVKAPFSIPKALKDAGQ